MTHIALRSCMCVSLVRQLDCACACLPPRGRNMCRARCVRCVCVALDAHVSARASASTRALACVSTLHQPTCVCVRPRAPLPRPSCLAARVTGVYCPGHTVSVVAVSPTPQLRRCTPRPETESKARPHSSHGYCPDPSVLGGPCAPDRQRLPQLPHRVRGPSGPGVLPGVSSARQLHQPQRHWPPSQSREWTPSARKESNVRSHLPHGKRPSASFGGGPL